MRTTVTIDDNLLDWAKQRAREQQQTLGELVEDALRRHLMAPPAKEGPPLAVSKRQGGVRPGIDPRSNASLYEAMDGDLSDLHA